MRNGDIRCSHTYLRRALFPMNGRYARYNTAGTLEKACTTRKRSGPRRRGRRRCGWGRRVRARGNMEPDRISCLAAPGLFDQFFLSISSILLIHRAFLDVSRFPFLFGLSAVLETQPGKKSKEILHHLEGFFWHDNHIRSEAYCRKLIVPTRLLLPLSDLQANINAVWW